MADSFNLIEQTPVSPPQDSQINQPLLPPISCQITLPSTKNNNNNNNRPYIYSGIIILILLVIFSFFVFNSKYTITISPKVNKKDNINSIIKNISTIASPSPTLNPNPTIVPIVGLSKLSAKETYIEMKKEQENFKTFDDYVAYYHKYGSKSERDFIDGVVKKLEPLKDDPYTAVYKNNILGTIKTVTPLLKDITKIDQVNTGTFGPNAGKSAVIYVSTNKPGVNGTIDFVLEDGAWKFDREQWTQ